MECYTCKSISGEKRISPGPTIHKGKYWLVEHAYPCALKAEEKDAIPPDEIHALCEHFKTRFDQATQ